MLDPQLRLLPGGVQSSPGTRLARGRGLDRPRGDRGGRVDAHGGDAAGARCGGLLALVLASAAVQTLALGWGRSALAAIVSTLAGVALGPIAALPVALVPERLRVERAASPRSASSRSRPPRSAPQVVSAVLLWCCVGRTEERSAGASGGGRRGAPLPRRPFGPRGSGLLVRVDRVDDAALSALGGRARARRSRGERRRRRGRARISVVRRRRIRRRRRGSRRRSWGLVALQHKRAQPDSPSRYPSDTSRNPRLETLARANDVVREHAIEAMESLSALVDARDSYTAGHSCRVAETSIVIGRELGLEGDELETLRRAALFHDIGKVSLPDSILLKAGPLTDVEWTAMQRHSVTGARIIARLGFLDRAVPASRHHHENYDGSGYPDGLAGDSIRFTPGSSTSRTPSTRCSAHASTATPVHSPPRSRRSSTNAVRTSAPRRRRPGQRDRPAGTEQSRVTVRLEVRTRSAVAAVALPGLERRLTRSSRLWRRHPADARDEARPARADRRLGEIARRAARTAPHRSVVPTGAIAGPVAGG